MSGKIHDEDERFIHDMVDDLDYTREKGGDLVKEVQKLAMSILRPNSKLETVLVSILCWSSFWLAYKRGQNKGDESQTTMNVLMALPFAIPLISVVYLPYAVMSCTGEEGGFLGSSCFRKRRTGF